MTPAIYEPEKRTVTLTRTFEAPARLLFLAYSRPEHISRWFGPVGWPVTLCELDFRVGGQFRMAMTGPSGVQNTPFGGTYLEIVQDKKIVFDDGFEGPGAEKMVMTVLLDEADGRTTLTLRIVFPSDAMYEGHVGGGIVEGTHSAFDQLQGVVAEMAG
jgi:uncharacterized protein YndB with AHSA1/START domain